MANIYRGELEKYGDFLLAEFEENVDSRPEVVETLIRLTAPGTNVEVDIPETKQPFAVIAVVDPDIIDECEDWAQRTEGLGRRLNSPVHDLGRVSLQAFPNAVMLGLPPEQSVAE